MDAMSPERPPHQQHTAQLDACTRVAVGDVSFDVRTETWFRVDAVDTPTRYIFGQRFPIREALQKNRGGEWDWATFDEFLNFFREVT